MPIAQAQTILFADVSGSTRMFETLGDALARQLISHVLEGLSNICRKHDGRVIKTIGDEVMCAFPRARDGVDAAIAMQRFLATDATCTANKLGIRIGLHHGDCLQEDDGDVFGDAVNTASRVGDEATRGQIVTSASTVADMRGVPFRSLGGLYVSGKVAPIDAVDIIWQENPGGMTMVQSALGVGTPGLNDLLVLEFKGRSIELRPTSQTLTLGRDPASGLIIEADWVSRNHAMIEYQRGHYLLTDRSTNGSFLRIDGDDEQRLHRDEAKLRRSGVISLGRDSASNSDLLVYFRCP